MTEQALPPVLTLPNLRQDLELIPGPAVPGVGQTWRIRDPARNRFFDIGPLEFLVLSEWGVDDSVAALNERVSAKLGAPFEAADLDPLLRFLHENELLSPASKAVRTGLVQRHRQNRQKLGTWLLHNYLFFRIPLFRPEPLLDALLPRLRWLYSPRAFLLLALVGLVDLHLLSRQWAAFTSNFQYTFSWEGAALVAIAGSIGKLVHEFAHALTARRYGVRVPTIGVAFLVLFPVLYTDTGDTWRLTDRRKRLAVTAAGMIGEFSLAILATLLWCLTADGALRTAFFYLAFVSWLLALFLNASPFMRFDGYFILSDFLDMPNLHQRCAALARNRLRRTFFGIDDPDPEPHLEEKRKRFLFAFAVATWLYRFVVFLSIALLVYHAFFKLLGIFLMMVEIAWFILRPIYSEAAALYQRKSDLRPRWPALGLFLAALPVAAWIPLSLTAVSAPALQRARIEQAVQAPSAGLLVAIHTRNGDGVPAGSELVSLASPEVALRSVTASIKRAALESELERTAANDQSRERAFAIREEIATTQALGQLAESEGDLLRLRASAAGTVRDMLPAAVPGRWVRSRETLMRIVSTDETVIDAYVPETQIGAIQVGMRATFYPENTAEPVITGKVVSIDATALKRISASVLASANGGPIASVKGPAGEFLAVEGRYRVVIAPDEKVPVARSSRGIVRIQGDWRAAISALPARAISIVLRESGF